MSDRKVVVKNVSKFMVGLSFPNSNFHRLLKGEGSKVFIPFDVIEEGISEPGTLELFEDGLLVIENKQDRIDLGLEDPDEEENDVPTVLSSREILAILERRSPTEIAAMFDGLAKEQKQKAAQVAIENKISDYGTVTLIKKYTGVDVLKAIQQVEDNTDK